MNVKSGILYFCRATSYVVATQESRAQQRLELPVPWLNVLGCNTKKNHIQSRGKSNSQRVLNQYKLSTPALTPILL